jgi:hypothetical protein
LKSAYKPLHFFLADFGPEIRTEDCKGSVLVSRAKEQAAREAFLLSCPRRLQRSAAKPYVLIVPFSQR